MLKNSLYIATWARFRTVETLLRESGKHYSLLPAHNTLCDLMRSNDCDVEEQMSQVSEFPNINAK